MAQVWFTSDTHFGHSNIIRHCNRPFADTNEMDEALIENWNSKVKANDIVWHLGDFSFHRSSWQPDSKIVARLHGIKNIVSGNHDNLSFLNRKCGWNEVHEHLTQQQFELNGEKIHIVLSHYPLREWPGFWHGVYHLFGHVHNGLPPYGRSMDVGVDTNNFMPYSLEQIVQTLNPAQNKHPDRKI